MVKNTNSKMDKYLTKLNKKYNLGAFSGRNRDQNIETYNTGSHVLDDVIGAWGLPKGRVVQYAGQESSGKTFMSLMAIKAWQQKDPSNWAVFVDAEYTYDEDWVESLGVDIDRVLVIPENNGAKIFTYLCGVPNKDPNKPKQANGLLDEILEEGGAEASGLGIIVIDSIAAMAPPMEVASVSGKANMALMARFMPPELRKITPLLSKTKVTLIAINQVRVDPGVMWGNPEGSPGGKAWKHACSLMVHFSSSIKTDMKIFSQEKEQIGHIVKARIDKNKVAPAWKTCEFGIEYVKGIHNPADEISELAIKYGVVQRPNNRTYVYGDHKWTSKDQFISGFADVADINTILTQIKEAKLQGAVASKITEGDENVD